MSLPFTTTAATSPNIGESTLSGTREDIKRAIGRFLGISRDDTDWTAEQTQDVADIIESGERTFYLPVNHTWSFLRPEFSQAINEPYGTGTIAATDGTVTLTTGTWPSWAADGFLVVDGAGYKVDSRTSGSIIVLEDDSVTITSGTSYSLERWEYTLPDDFGGFLETWLSFVPENNKICPVRQTGIAEILQLRAQNLGNVSTQPEVFAVQAKASDRTAGQRFKIFLYPVPQQAGALVGRYYAVPWAISDAAPYPLGGQPHFETLLEACLAAAELHMNDTLGVHTQKFQERLAASISHDRRMSPRHFGYNYDSRTQGISYRRVRGDLVTYDNLPLVS